MSNTTVIIIAVVVVLIALLAFKFIHNHGIHNDVENLKNVCSEIFSAKGVEKLASQDFIKALKEKTGVSQKVALTLFGKARQLGIIRIVDRFVELVK